MRSINRIKPFFLTLIKNASENGNVRIIFDPKINFYIDLNIYSEVFSYLQHIWLSFPDLRFTQLCVTLRLIPNIPGSWYYIEDDELLKLNNYDLVHE